MCVGVGGGGGAKVCTKSGGSDSEVGECKNAGCAGVVCVSGCIEDCSSGNVDISKSLSESIVKEVDVGDVSASVDVEVNVDEDVGVNVEVGIFDVAD